MKRHAARAKGIFFLLFISFLFISRSLPKVAGTDIAAIGPFASFLAVSIEKFTTFPEKDGNNKVAGFAWMKSGFALENSLTTCTFDSGFQVGKSLELREGRLCLISDLFLSNDITFTSGGSIYGNGCAIDFTPSVTYLGFSSAGNILNNLTVKLAGNLILTGVINVEGDCVIEGNASALNLKGATIRIFPDSSLKLKNLFVKNVRSGRLYCTDSSGELTLDNVYWLQDGDYTFSNGGLKIEQEVLFTGAYTFSYEASRTFTIDSLASLIVDFNSKLSYAPSISRGDLLFFADSTSRLLLNNASLLVTNTCLQLLRGRVFLNGECSLESEHGIDIGNGNDSDDLFCEIEVGSSLNFKGSSLNYKNASFGSLFFVNNFSAFRINEGELKLHQSMDARRGRLELADGTVLSKRSGKGLKGSTFIEGTVTLTTF